MEHNGKPLSQHDRYDLIRLLQRVNLRLEACVLDMQAMSKTYQNGVKPVSCEQAEKILAEFTK